MMKKATHSVQPLAVNQLPTESRYSIETQAVHSGRDDFRSLGVHAPPLDFSTTYPVTSLEAAASSLDGLAAGGAPENAQGIYARLHNPTVARFEQALARLEGASNAVAFSSGMAALTACLLASRNLAKGSSSQVSPIHVVAVRPLYGGSDHLLSSHLLGVETSWASADRVAEAIRPETELVIIETPANPTLKLIDIQAVAEQAGEVAVLVDSTFATPVLQKPLDHGAALVLHSATKFLGGHGDVMAGVVATSDESWAAALRQVRVLTGAVLHPLAGYLLHRGLVTLPLRVQAAQERAIVLARRLSAHPDVAAVFFPGLAMKDPQGLVGRQMNGPGTLVTFELKAGYEVAAKLLGHLGIITPAVSLGSTDTLIQHPAGMTHRIVPAAAQREGGISPGMLRLSVGLEDVEDLWQDLESALARAEQEVKRCEENRGKLAFASSG